MAMDGTVIDLPDTPENVRAFGKRRAPRGESAWPQARVVAISECATHAICEAGTWPHDFDEHAAGRRLLRGGVVGEGVLLLWDRGFHGFDMVRAALAIAVASCSGVCPPRSSPRYSTRSPMAHASRG